MIHACIVLDLHVFRIATQTTRLIFSSSLANHHARHRSPVQSVVSIHAHYQSRVSPSLVSQNSAPPASSRYSPPARLATVILAVKKEGRHSRESEAQKNLALDQTGIPERHNYIQLKSFSSCTCKKRTSGMPSRDLARYKKGYVGELRVWHLYIAIFFYRQKRVAEPPTKLSEVSDLIRFGLRRNYLSVCFFFFATGLLLCVNGFSEFD